MPIMIMIIMFVNSNTVHVLRFILILLILCILNVYFKSN